MMNTTKAITMKLIKLARNAPHEITIGPMANVASCQAPPGMNGVTIGIITLFTSDCTSAVAASPIINATASAITLYSRKNSLNSDISPIFTTQVHFHDSIYKFL